MVHFGSLAMRSIGRRGALLLAAFAVSIGMLFATAAGPVTQAHAGGEYFCYSAVGPWGTCQGPGRWLTWVRALGYQHFACSDAVYQGNVVTNWACAAPNTWSNSYFDGSRFMSGIIKNNAAGNGQIWGYEEFL